MQRSSFHAWCETTLGGIGLFCCVDIDVLLSLGQRAHWQEPPVGHTLIRRGDGRRTFFALVRGTVQLRDAELRTTETCGEGEVLGLRTCLRRTPATINVVVAAPSLVAEIARADLFHAITECTTLAHNVANLLDGRGGARRAHHEVDARIAAALVRAADPQPEGRLAPVAVDVAVWSTLMSLDPVDVERALRRLERDGLIRPHRRGNMLVDTARLRRRLV